MTMYVCTRVASPSEHRVLTVGKAYNVEYSQGVISFTGDDAINHTWRGEYINQFKKLPYSPKYKVKGFIFREHGGAYYRALGKGTVH